MLRRLSVIALLAVNGIAALTLTNWVAQARAGDWIQVVCANPDGSTAPAEGWSTTTLGSPPVTSSASTRCTATSPMQAYLAAAQRAPSGAAEVLRYAPPAGSTLVGGTLQVGLYANGYGTGSDTYTYAGAGVLEPDLSFGNGDIVKRCVESQHLCQAGTDDYVGPVSLPANAAGDLYVEADCNGFNASGGCDTGDPHYWALAQLTSAELLLRNDATPAASGFGGAILKPRATGVAAFGFTASDPGGPGVYAVTIAVDGISVYSGTPNPQDGACVPVGRDSSSGALMFDYQQPCPASQPVLAGIPTTNLKDGRHTLTVTVTDAAGNSRLVLDQPITTRNSGSTPARLPRLHLRMVFYWHWDGVHTTLLRAAVRRAPRRARAVLSCRGGGCPPPAVLARRALAGRGSLRRVLRGLAGLGFHSGDRVWLTFSAPGHTPERIRFAIRTGRLPGARRVSSR